MTSFQALALSQLVVVLDGEGLLRTDERALGPVDGRDADLRPHVLELQPLLDQLGWIDLDAYGRRLLAADAHERRARASDEVLGEDIFSGVVDVDNRRAIRPNGQDQDGRVGRVDLAISRWTGQILRQLSGGGVDRSLDVVGGGVDVAVEIELDADRRHAERACRRHLRDARDLRDLPFERLRDRGRHRLGEAPGSEAATVMVGKSICGRGATGSDGKATRPTRNTATMMSVVAIGR